jgi:UDP-3-O-[3-hydroxymyristoyl] glucosamine N-acyltransferase
VIHETASIHVRAWVDESVSIGARTKVWQFASITRGTVLGEDCSVSPLAMLDGSIYGDRALISAGFAAGAGFKVGSDVFIGPNVTLCNDMWPRSDKEGYDDAALRSGERFAVIIGDRCTIGANAVILPGVRIGDGSIVAAGAVVTRSIAPGLVLKRNGYCAPLTDDWRRERMRWAA